MDQYKLTVDQTLEILKYVEMFKKHTIDINVYIDDINNNKQYLLYALMVASRQNYISSRCNYLIEIVKRCNDLDIVFLSKSTSPHKTIYVVNNNYLQTVDGNLLYNDNLNFNTFLSYCLVNLKYFDSTYGNVLKENIAKFNISKINYSTHILTKFYYCDDPKSLMKIFLDNGFDINNNFFHTYLNFTHSIIFTNRKIKLFRLFINSGLNVDYSECVTDNFKIENYSLLQSTLRHDFFKGTIEIIKRSKIINNKTLICYTVDSKNENQIFALEDYIYRKYFNTLNSTNTKMAKNRKDLYMILRLLKPKDMTLTDYLSKFECKTIIDKI